MARYRLTRIHSGGPVPMADCEICQQSCDIVRKLHMESIISIQKWSRMMSIIEKHHYGDTEDGKSSCASAHNFCLYIDQTERNHFKITNTLP